MGKVIGVMSFKGGVGKTVTSINLAASFVRMGKSAIVIDGNFLSPNLHLYLGLLEPKKTLRDVVRDGVDVRNAIYSHKSGIDLLPCSFYKGVDFDLFRNVFEKLRERYDYLIVDSGPSYTDEVIAVLAVCDELVFVATPDYPTLAATVRLTKFAKFKGVRIVGVILNRVRKKRFEVGWRDVEKTVGADVLGEVREDAKVMRSVKGFVPVVWKFPKASSSKCFLRIAKKLM